MHSTIEYLTDKAATTAAVSREPWPAVNAARALTREERGWLDMVPVDPTVHIGAMAMTYAGGLWKKRVRHALEQRTGTLRREGDWLIATLHGQEQRVNLLDAPMLGAGAVAGPTRVPAAASPARTLAPRPASFFKHRTGGTYASHAYKDD